MIYGLDFLGGAKYPEVVLKNHPKGYAFGVFLEVDGFGKADGLIEKMARSGKAPAIRVHLMWRDDHDFRGQLPEIERRAKRLQGIASRFPDVAWYVSPCCEHNLDAATISRFASRVKKLCPSARFVNSVFRGAILKGEINEVHGKHPKPAGDYIYSYDGEACVDSDIEARKRSHKDSRIFFLWEPRFNGRWESNDNTPRPQRKGWPDSKLIKSVTVLAQTNNVAVTFPKKWLWKSHSENHGKGDLRAEKPVLIIPQKVASIQVLDSKNKLVTTLKYYGPFSGGGHRYYSPIWGYEIAAKARKNTGHEGVWLKFPGAPVNYLHPARRAGSFR